MLLRPRRYNYKNIQKKRKYITNINRELIFGQCGLQLLQPLRLTNKHISRFKIFFKKGSRKTDKTLRFCWFNVFPHLPLTKKVIGSRMGKGKGKLYLWYIKLPSGIILVEFKNLRTGRVNYFLKEVSFKISSKTQIVNLYKKRIPLALKTSKKIIIQTFL